MSGTDDPRAIGGYPLPANVAQALIDWIAAGAPPIEIILARPDKQAFWDRPFILTHEIVEDAKIIVENSETSQTDTLFGYPVVEVDDLPTCEITLGPSLFEGVE